MPVEIALTPDNRRPVSQGEICVAARRAGFSALGISASRVDQNSAAAFEASSLRCHEVLALLLRGEADTVRECEVLAAKAAVVGAPWVLTSFRSPLDQRTREVVKECAAVLADAGVRMAVEFTALGPLRTIAEGLAAVSVAGEERAGLIIDSWHFFVGPNSWKDLTEVPLERIAYVQFDDAPSMESRDLMDETMNRRVFPGDGSFDLHRFASTLLDRGWEGTVSVEVLNRDLLKLPLHQFCDRAYEATESYWK